MQEIRTTFTAVIIEDEVLIRLGFKELLQAYCPNIEVIGEAESVHSGVSLIKFTKPNIVFLDIMLQDGSGFDVLDGIEFRDFHLIFTTSHDNFAIKAFQYNAINYLLKPIDPDLLVAAIERLPTKINEDSQRMQLDALNESFISGQHKQITIAAKEGLYFVKLKEVVRLESNGNLVTFFLDNGKRIMVTTKSMKDYESILSTDDFYRTHQSHIIQRKFIASYLFEDGGQALMINNDRVPVSRRKKDAFLEWIKEM